MSEIKANSGIVTQINLFTVKPENQQATHRSSDRIGALGLSSSWVEVRQHPSWS
jgi:hypothetical protein